MHCLLWVVDLAELGAKVKNLELTTTIHDQA